MQEEGPHADGDGHWTRAAVAKGPLEPWEAPKEASKDAPLEVSEEAQTG